MNRYMQAAALGCLACCGIREARAVCKEPLPASDLRPLDELAIADPVSAARGARTALESDRDPSRRAQLHAILADAHNTTGEDSAALQDIRQGREELDAAGAFEGEERVRLRLALVEADAAHSREEMLAAVTSLDQWNEIAERQPIGRACLLLVRSRVLSRLGMHELSARDGLEAHEIATRSGSADAIGETHFQLANAFRRAGLFEQAMPHVDSAIALARSRNQAASVSSAAYLKGQILGDWGRTQEARGYMLESRQVSLDLSDAVSVGFSDQWLCDFELRLGSAAKAREYCSESREAMQKAGREDMVAIADELAARVDLATGKPVAALERLRRVLRDDGTALPPYALVRAYRTLADAYSGLGRHSEAVAALRRSLEVEGENRQLQRSLAAALALAQFDRQAQERREAQLNREVTERREQARAASLSRQRAWTWFAGSVLVIGLLLALLGASRRNARVLRRQEALFNAVSSHSTDAIALLTADGRVQLASRDLFGREAPPAPGAMLLESAPPSLRDSLREVLALLLEDGVAVERDLRVEAHGSGAWRDFELRAYPIFQSGQLIGATLRTTDVTARRTAEREALEWLERQREKAGGGLHEGVAQELAGVSMRLGAIATAQRSGREVAADTLEASIAQLSDAIAVTRDLATELSPLLAGRGSLQHALARLAADAGRRSGASVEFTGTGEAVPDLGRAAELVYRIAELALLAPASPGAATTTLGLELPPEGIHLVVESQDGFRSLDPRSLQLIRYLATLVGASTHLQQLGENGWRLRVAVPRSGFSG